MNHIFKIALSISLAKKYDLYLNLFLLSFSVYLHHLDGKIKQYYNSFSPLEVKI